MSDDERDYIKLSELSDTQREIIEKLKEGYVIHRASKNSSIAGFKNAAGRKTMLSHPEKATITGVNTQSFKALKRKGYIVMLDYDDERHRNPEYKTYELNTDRYCFEEE